MSLDETEAELMAKRELFERLAILFDEKNKVFRTKEHLYLAIGALIDQRLFGVKSIEDLKALTVDNLRLSSYFSKREAVLVAKIASQL